MVTVKSLLLYYVALFYLSVMKLLDESKSSLRRTITSPIDSITSVAAGALQRQNRNRGRSSKSPAPNHDRGHNLHHEKQASSESEHLI